eukprot:COSAG02_NODE_7432_length_3015_cov_6.358025_1_plen_110_part_00
MGQQYHLSTTLRKPGVSQSDCVPGCYGCESLSQPHTDVCCGSAHALEEARQMAADWDTLEGIVSEPRFSAVLGRFKQQNVDAVSFSEVVVGFYLNISGHHFGWPIHRPN